MAIALDKAAVRMLVAASMRNPSEFESDLRTLRMPAPTIWVEYDDLDRMEAVAAASGEDLPRDRPFALRIAYMLREEGDGAIRCDAFFSSQVEGEGAKPAIATFAAGLCLHPHAPVTGKRGSHYRLLFDRETAEGLTNYPTELSAAVNCSAMMSIRPGTAIERSWTSILMSHVQAGRNAMASPTGIAISEAWQMIRPDWLLLVSLLRLWNARVLDMGQTQPVRWSRRLKHGARKDHTAEIRQVSVDLPRMLRQASGESATGTGSPKRRHLVSGHYVRRGDARHWRRSHERGSAELGEVGKVYLATSGAAQPTKADQASAGGAHSAAGL